MAIANNYNYKISMVARTCGGRVAKLTRMHVSSVVGHVAEICCHATTALAHMRSVHVIYSYIPSIAS